MGVITMINQPSDDEMDLSILELLTGEAAGELFDLQNNHRLVAFVSMSGRTKSRRYYEELIKSFNRDTSRFPESDVEYAEVLSKYLDALRRAIDEVRSKILH